MATSKINKLPKNTAEVIIDIPWNEVKDTHKTIFDKVVKEAEVTGFRKGKAPKKMVEEKVDKAKVYEEVIRDIIPKVYTEAIKKHELTPIASPKVEVVKAKEGEDWQIKTTVALKPIIDLGKYKEKVQELKKSKVKIWKPGDKEDEKDNSPKKPSLEELTKALISETKAEISDLLIEQESNRLLSDLIDQTKKLGLNIDQYLAAKGKTSEQIRNEFKIQAENNIKIEFVLAEIADKEKISVSQTDIDNLLSKVEKPEEKERLKKDSYYLAHLIRQQKTLDYLANL